MEVGRTADTSIKDLTSKDLTKVPVTKISTAKPAEDFLEILRGDQPNYPESEYKL